MIAIPDLIDTASKSTARYLDLLTQAGKGGKTHTATNVRPSPKRTTLIGNKSWPVIECDLPKHERFPPDSGAVFVPTNHPGRRIEAQILDYDRRSGRAEIAVEVLPPDKEGLLVIDFKWLIKRCLDWLMKNGRNVSNPFLLPAGLDFPIRHASGAVALSDEQSKAITSLLSHPAGYVWGPPGTGKTRHVLAETVGHLIKSGKRVVVAAPTNLAVDNALDAILGLACVPDHQILRVGIPSAEFSHKWPECCEERALQGRLNELEAQAERIAKRIDSGRRCEELEWRIPEQDEIAARIARVVVELDEACRAMESRIGAVEERFEAAAAGRLRVERQIDGLRLAHASLKLDELRNGIGALEADQMKLVSERRSLEKEISEVGWLARMFTGRCQELGRTRSAVEARIAEVEGTLRSQRLRRESLESQGDALISEISALDAELSAFAATQHESEVTRQLLAAENLALKERRARAASEAADASEKLRLMLEEREVVMALGDPPDDTELALLREELIEVRAKMARITQDLSEKLVLGMTLDGFIGLTMNQALHVDHIVVDEAGYAPLAKVLPLLIQGCPISLLGDHRQLPPVYEGSKDVLSEANWGVSALYLEEAFQPGIGDDPEQMVIHAKKDPRFQQLHRSQLTTSYRFGPELADLLDRHFYKISLKSHASTGTQIRSKDCPQTGPLGLPAGQKYENAAEANRIMNAVKKWVEWKPDSDKGGLAILTPYRNQVRLIRDALKALGNSGAVVGWRHEEWEDFRSVEVMTVNRSQGREWDTVFFSACDTGRLAGNEPFLADTACLAGSLVVNTAISRSKKFLRFFLDRQFWAGRAEPSLLTEVARERLK